FQHLAAGPGVAADHGNRAMRAIVRRQHPSSAGSQGHRQCGGQIRVRQPAHPVGSEQPCHLAGPPHAKNPTTVTAPGEPGRPGVGVKGGREHAPRPPGSRGRLSTHCSAPGVEVASPHAARPPEVEVAGPRRAPPMVRGFAKTAPSGRPRARTTPPLRPADTALVETSANRPRTTQTPTRRVAGWASWTLGASALAVLRRLAGLLEAVLLPLLGPRVTGQEA